MKRSTDRILTTHTGSLPRTAKVVELLLAEQQKPGARRAELTAAVREAVAYVVQKQVECGLDIINDGEQGRTDYTVHVLDRLTGYRGRKRGAHGHRRGGISRAGAIAQAFCFAVPASACLQRRRRLEGLGRRRRPTSILAKDAMAGAEAEEFFFTSPSPGQIARYLKNRYYKTEEATSTRSPT